MRYVVVFGLVGCYLGVTAALVGGWAWLLAYPAASFLALAVAYAGAGPSLFGKRPDGRLAWWSYLLLGPVLSLLWAVWYLQKSLSAEPASHEVAPGVWVGRRPSARDLPTGVAHVVDPTAEFPAARGVVAGYAYRSLPTLDGVAPDDAGFRALAEFVAGLDAPVYLHCAMGHGRSATLAASVLILRGLAPDVRTAEEALRRARPGVRLTPAQRRLLRCVHENTQALPER
jgi:protein-tyrosine phosphatase